MRKKGQSATEFITTYGFALVIIAIGVGAVFYLTSGRVQVPTQCNFNDPFSCNDLKVQPTSATLDITASGTAPGSRVAMVINGVSSSCGALSGVRQTITCPGTFGDEGEHFSGTISLEYTLEGGTIPHTSVFTISGTIEEA